MIWRMPLGTRCIRNWSLFHSIYIDSLLVKFPLVQLLTICLIPLALLQLVLAGAKPAKALVTKNNLIVFAGHLLYSRRLRQNSPFLYLFSLFFSLFFFLSFSLFFSKTEYLGTNVFKIFYILFIQFNEYLFSRIIGSLEIFRQVI